MSNASGNFQYGGDHRIIEHSHFLQIILKKYEIIKLINYWIEFSKLSDIALKVWNTNVSKYKPIQICKPNQLFILFCISVFLVY